MCGELRPPVARLSKVAGKGMELWDERVEDGNDRRQTGVRQKGLRRWRMESKAVRQERTRR